MELIPFLIDLSVAAVCATLIFVVGAILAHFIKLQMIERESKRIDLLAKRATVKMALDESDLKTQVIRLDENGLPPISRAVIDSGAMVQANMQAILAFIESQRTHAPVPHSLTYAPHIKNDKGLTVAEPAGLLEAPIVQPKDFFQLYEAGSLPSNKLLIGFDMEDNTPVITSWDNLYSCLIGGLSGMGKSTLICNLLAQSALQGGRFVVLDPHFNSGDQSLGASLAPLQERMLRPVAHDDKTMLSALAFVADVGKRRLEGKDKDRSPLVLIVDETTALLQRGAIAEQLIAVLEMIAQETRKVSIYAMCIGQNFAAEVMKSTARDSFVSMISCRARRKVARIQADSPEFGLMAANLDRGQVVWMAPSGELKRVAVPNTTAEHLAHVGTVLNAQKNADGSWTATGVKPSSKASSKQRQPLLSDDAFDDGLTMPDDGFDDAFDDAEPLIVDANAQRVLAMFYSGSDLPDAITTVYGVTKSGGKYQTISRQIQAILRTQGGAR